MKSFIIWVVLILLIMSTVEISAADEGVGQRSTPLLRILQTELSSGSKIPDQYYVGDDLKGAFFVVMAKQAVEQFGYIFQTQEDLDSFEQQFWARNPGLRRQSEVLVKITTAQEVGKDPGIFVPSMPLPAKVRGAASSLEVVDEVARFRADATNRTAESAVAIAVKTSAEMEAFAALHEGNTQRVTALEREANETAAGLTSLQQKLDGQGTAIGDVNAVLDKYARDQNAALRRQVARVDTHQQSLDTLTNLAAAPPKRDWFALGLVALALALLLGLLRRNWKRVTDVSMSLKDTSYAVATANAMAMSYSKNSAAESLRLNEQVKEAREVAAKVMSLAEGAHAAISRTETVARDAQINAGVARSVADEARETALGAAEKVFQYSENLYWPADFFTQLDRVSSGAQLVYECLVKRRSDNVEFTVHITWADDEKRFLINGIDDQGNSVSGLRIQTVVGKAAEPDRSGRVRLKGVEIPHKAPAVAKPLRQSRKR